MLATIGLPVVERGPSGVGVLVGIAVGTGVEVGSGVGVAENSASEEQAKLTTSSAVSRNKKGYFFVGITFSLYMLLVSSID